MKSRFVVALIGSVMFLALTAGTLPAVEQTADFESVPVKGMVTMIDLGAKKCIPCKMMAPIMEKLEKEYRGRADILFIDVWKHPDQAKRFNVKAIPTQIFYDKEGKEVDRHIGFLKESAIVGKLKYLGVD